MKIYDKVPDLAHYEGSLDELIEILEKLKLKYGGNAIIEFDSGWEPMEVLISKTEY